MSYIIASLNTKQFTGVGTHDVGLLADIILSERFDIIALQEVMRPQVVDLLKRRLPNWEGSHGVTSSQGNSGDLGLAFLWNTKRIRECSKDGEPEIYTRYLGKMSRCPYYGRFTPNGLLGGAFYEIRLINIHLHHGGSDSVGNIEKRLDEFRLVSSDIYESISKRRYGNNMPAYTFVLGDYNLCAWKCQIAEATGYYASTLQDEKTTLKHKEDGFNNDYDHFGVNKDRFEGTVVDVKRIDTVQKYLHNDFQLHLKKVSDHIPVKLEFILNAR